MVNTKYRKRNLVIFYEMEGNFYFINLIQIFVYCNYF